MVSGTDRYTRAGSVERDRSAPKRALLRSPSAPQRSSGPERRSRAQSAGREHKIERTDRPAREVVDHNGDAADAAGRNIVGHLKEHIAERGNDDTDCEQEGLLLRPATLLTYSAGVGPHAPRRGCLSRLNVCCMRILYKVFARRAVGAGRSQTNASATRHQPSCLTCGVGMYRSIWGASGSPARVTGVVVWDATDSVLQISRACPVQARSASALFYQSKRSAVRRRAPCSAWPA